MEPDNDTIPFDSDFAQPGIEVPVRIPATEITKHATLRHLRKVLITVKNYYLQAPSEYKERYYNGIGRLLSTNREDRRVFAKAVRASLRPELQRSFETLKLFPDLIIAHIAESEAMAETVLEIWCDSQEPLITTVKDQLLKHNFPVDIVYMSHGFRGMFPDELSKLLEQFCHDQSKQNVDDVQLVFACLTSYLPPAITEASMKEAADSVDMVESGINEAGAEEVLSDEDPADSESQSDPELIDGIWQQWLDHAESINPEAADWDSARLFVKRFNEIVNSKLETRATCLQRVNDALALLRSKFPDELTALDAENTSYPPHTAWQVGLHSLPVSQTLTVEIERLMRNFREQAEVREALGDRGIGPKEFRNLLDRARSLSEEGTAGYSGVAKQLSGGVVYAEVAATQQKQQEVSGEFASAPEFAGATTEHISQGPAESQPIESPRPIDEPTHDSEPAVVILDATAGGSPESRTQPIYRFAVDEISLDIARRILKSEAPARAQGVSALIWRLVYEDQLDLAFNCSRWLHDSGAETTNLIPHWLLAVMILGRHVLEDNERICSEMASNFQKFDSSQLFLTDQKEWNQAIRLMAAAASLRAALIAQSSNAPSVLRVLEFSGLGYLYRYCQFIAGRAEDLQFLDLATLNRIKDYVSWKSNLDTLREDVNRWQQDAGKQQIRYEPALRVWKMWLREGLIHELLSPIGQNTFGRDNVFEDKVDRLSHERAIVHEIDVTDRIQLARPKFARSIDTKHPSAKKLIDLTLEAVHFAKRWVELQKTRPQSYIDKQNEKLGYAILSDRDAIIAELDSYEKSVSSLPVLAGISQCRRALNDLWSLVDPAVPLPAVEPDPELLLNANLLRNPWFDLDDNWQPETKDQPQLLNQVLSLIAAPERTLESAFEIYRSQGDHRATGRIVSFLQCNPEADQTLDAAKLATAREKSIREWREAIERRSKAAVIEVQRAVRNDWLTDEAADDYLKLIRSIDETADATLMFGAVLKDFDQALAALRERARSERAQIEQRLREAKITDKVPGYSLIESALSRGDLRLVGEYVDTLADGGTLPLEKPHTDHLKTFFPGVIQNYNAERKKHDAIIREVRGRKEICGVHFESLSAPQIDAAVELLKTWFDVIQRKVVGEGDIDKILTLLGFEDVHATQVKHYGKRWWFDATSRDLRNKKVCPVPSFGSLARGRYRLLCVLDNPVGEELFEAVGNTPPNEPPVIVFYFGGLAEFERRELARLCRADAHSRTFLVLDDSLLLYLCSQPVGRLRTLFDCTLPFTWLEPYVTSGRVPLETFYGRADEKASIMSPRGAFFIYGGKRLGKTALLYEVVEEFHKPSFNQVAILIDLKERGIGLNLPMDHVWRLIAEKLQDEKLKHLKIFPSGMTTNTNDETLLKHIETWLKANDTRRILILLDEADQFLERDGEEKNPEGDAVEFIRVHRLMRLWEETRNRFKVVFAGLHNVLRTTNYTKKVNPSIAHFGDNEEASKSIGPLMGPERDEAFALVEDPMYSLGYRFQSPDLVLSILTRTNWYPSLIQLYCQQLLKRLRPPKNPIYDQKSAPPYVITSKHVDDAYAVLSESLKARFRMTLLLDSRYWVIAHSIAHRLLSERKDDPTASLTVQEIQQEALKWWPEGFRATRSENEDSFRILLEEMIGLGVVRENGEGRYTLRNVNVFSILGPASKVEEALRDKPSLPSGYEASVFRSAYSGHGPDSADGWRRSPLTAQQVSALQANKNGASIIYGCRAAGLDYLSEFVELAFGSGNYARIVSATDAETFSEELRTTIVKRADSGVTVIDVDSSLPWDQNWIVECLKQLNALTSKKSWVRVIFVANPRKTWDLISNHLLSTGTQGLTPFSLTAWQDTTVAQWFEECFDFPVAQDDRDLLKMASGNWPILLGELYRLERASSEWKPQTVDKFLGTFDDASQVAMLSEAFGLDTSGPVDVLNDLVKTGPVTSENLAARSGRESSFVSNSLRWAQVLALAMPKEELSWHVDSVVEEVLKKAPPVAVHA